MDEPGDVVGKRKFVGELERDKNFNPLNTVEGYTP